jgi:hypothetical protein
MSTIPQRLSTTISAPIPSVMTTTPSGRSAKKSEQPSETSPSASWVPRYSPASLVLSASAGLLFVTAAMKLLSVASGQRILLADDPILGVPYWFTMSAGGMLDLFMAGFLISRKNRAVRLLGLFWLGIAFCGYHLALKLFEPDALCPCLGTLYGRLGLNAASAKLIAQSLAVWFAAAPVAVLLGARAKSACSLRRRFEGQSESAPGHKLTLWWK